MIDLQIHTIATPHHSFWKPEELIQAALAVGLTTIAATDHNTTSGVRQVMNFGDLVGLRVIPGVEIDSGFNGKLWHTLVYGVEPENTALQAICDEVFERNRRDAEALRQRLLRNGFQLESLATLGRSANVADVATALAHENLLPGRDQAEPDESAGMRHVLQRLPGAYRPIGIDEIIPIAHKAGGKVVLAHPGRSKGIYAIPADEVDIAAMTEAGIDGLEVYYPSHTPQQQQYYLALANRYELLITGGSDSHGPAQPLAQWPEASCQAFLDSVGAGV